MGASKVTYLVPSGLSMSNKCPACGQRLKPRRRRRESISKAEALRRLRRMVRAIDENVRIVLQTEAVLEAGNDLIRAGAGKDRPDAFAYEVIQAGLAMQLALCLARLFDKGAKRFKPNRRELASIPLMMRLVRQQRCRQAVVEAARRWPGQKLTAEGTCTRAINQMSQAYRSLGTAPLRSAVRRVKVFRNDQLAHTKLEPSRTKPFFRDLFSLVKVARNISQPARLIVEGVHIDLAEDSQVYRKSADRYWKHAFRLDEK